MAFIYDPNLKGSGYRDTATGRIVSHAAVRDSINQVISTSENVQGALAGLVSSGGISPQDWHTALRQEIKDNYISQYLAGIGGREQMTSADWGSIGGMLTEQYRYLEGFYTQVAAGELTEAQIYARSRMYINSSREAYERALERAAARRGYTEHRWTLGIAEHCDDCIALDAGGWKPVTEPFIAPSSGVPTVPGRGDTECLCITTPNALVYTKRGLVPMLNVAVGELVLTHKGRFMPVTGISVKPVEGDGAWEGLVRGPTGNLVGCTMDHLWYTEAGWIPFSDIGSYAIWQYTYSNPFNQEVCYEELHPVWQANQETVLDMQEMFIGLRVWNQEGSSSKEVYELRQTRQGIDSMASWATGSTRRSSQGWERTQNAARRFVTRNAMATERGRTLLDLVLGWGHETHSIPLSVGVDDSQRSDSERNGCSSQERGQGGRPLGEPRIIVQDRACTASRGQYGRVGALAATSSARVDMPMVRQGIPAFTEEAEGRLSRAEILLGSMLAPGTAIYDLQVDEDHSFVIEGLAAHNTNCACSVQYR